MRRYAAILAILAVGFGAGVWFDAGRGAEASPAEAWFGNPNFGPEAADWTADDTGVHWGPGDLGWRIDDNGAFEVHVKSGDASPELREIAERYLVAASPAEVGLAAQAVVGQGEGITDPEAIRYCNEVLHPLAEKIRALDAEMSSALITYNAGVGDVFYNNTGEIIMDGREAEGIPRNTGNDALLMVTQMQAFKAQMDGAGVRNVISSWCVRPLEAR